MIAQNRIEDLDLQNLSKIAFQNSGDNSAIVRFHFFWGGGIGTVEHRPAVQQKSPILNEGETTAQIPKKATNQNKSQLSKSSLLQHRAIREKAIRQNTTN